MMKKLNIVVKRPSEPAEVIEIDNSLRELQRLVEGDIEWVHTSIFQHPLGIYCNEEGYRLKLKANVWIPDLDVVVLGPIIVVQADAWGNEISLTDMQARRAIEILNALSYTETE